MGVEDYTDEQLSQIDAYARSLKARAASPLLHIVDLCAVADKPPPQDIIAGIIPANFPSSIYGAGGQLKSYLLVHMVLCVVSGQSFLGRPVRKSPVIFVDYELDEDTTAQRARRIARGMGLSELPSGFHYVSAGHSLLTIRDELAIAIEQMGVGWVVIDSLGLAIAGNTQAEEGVIAVMGALRGLGVATTAIDHQGHVQMGQEYSQKEQFGSSYKGHLVRARWQVERAGARSLDTSVVDLILRQKKYAFGPEDTTGVGVRFTFDGDTVRVGPLDAAAAPSLATLLPDREKILQAVRDDPGETTKALAEITGKDQHVVETRLSELRRDGLVLREGFANPSKPGRWYPVSSHNDPSHSSESTCETRQ